MNVYKITDPDGVELVLSGPTVVTFEQRIDTEEESVFALGAPIGSYVPCETQIRVADLAGYSDALLARWKIARTVDADPDPDPPPPVRPSLRKSVVVNRLISAGHIADAMSALMADPAAFARWTAPDWPEVYLDDPDLLALLATIGADVTVILAPLGSGAEI